MLTSQILFTAKQKAELWERWKNGQSVLAISRALERRNKSGVQRIGSVHGGIAPVSRRRAVAALRLEEREEISRGVAAGRSVRRIARGLRRSPSTISREIRRNGGSRPNSDIAEPISLCCTMESVDANDVVGYGTRPEGGP